MLFESVGDGIQRSGIDRKDMCVPTWKAMVKAYKEGMVRVIGVSNFYPEQIEACTEETGIVPMVDQIEMHPYLVGKRRKKL